MAKKIVNAGVVVSLASLIASAVSVGDGFGVGNGIMQDALKAEADAANERAKLAVQGLIQNFHRSVNSAVLSLRAARQIASENEVKTKKLTRAFLYFGETGNPLPFFKVSGDTYGGQNFCRSIGVKVPADDHDAWNVPSDWKPVTTVPAV